MLEGAEAVGEAADLLDEQVDGLGGVVGDAAGAGLVVGTPAQDAGPPRA